MHCIYGSTTLLQTKRKNQFANISATSDKQAKMVLVKDSFSRIYLRNKWLHADKHCVEFCRHKCCFCRPLLALQKNKKSSSSYMWIISTQTGIFCYLFNGLADWHCAESNFSNLKFEYFSLTIFWLLVRGPSGFDSWKKCQRNIVTLPL